MRFGGQPSWEVEVGAAVVAVDLVEEAEARAAADSEDLEAADLVEVAPEVPGKIIQ
jgi:hypothetical protein